MGKSTTFRQGPSWQSNNTARGKESIGGRGQGRSNYSTGEGEQSRPKGGEMSSGSTRTVGHNARAKSKSSYSGYKTKTSFGQS